MPYAPRAIGIRADVKGAAMTDSYAIKGGQIITMDPEMTVLRDHAIVVSGSRIQDILPNRLLSEKYPSIEGLDCADKVLLPGLINSHMHSNIIRGFGDDLPLYQWHEEIAETVGRATAPQEAYLGAKIAYLEGIKSGTTALLGLEKYAGSCYAAACETGIRAIFVPYVLDFPDCTDTVELNLEMVQRTADPDARVRFWFGFDSFREAGEAMIRRIAGLAQEYNTGLHTHSNESVDDTRTCREMHQMDPIAYLSKVGVLGEKTVLAHGVHLTEVEMELVAKSGTKIAHCATSNMKLTDGAAPVTRYLAKGIEVGLGTDGANTNNNYDMFEEMKFAVLLQRIATNRASALVAADVLNMATIGGARVLGIADQTGSLEIGKKADICVMDLRKLHCLPYDPDDDSILISHLVFSASGADVDTVIIDGKIVMEGRVIKTADEAQLIKEANKAGKALLARLAAGGLKIH